MYDKCIFTVFLWKRNLDLPAPAVTVPTQFDFRVLPALIQCRLCLEPCEECALLINRVPFWYCCERLAEIVHKKLCNNHPLVSDIMQVELKQTVTPKASRTPSYALGSRKCLSFAKAPGVPFLLRDIHCGHGMLYADEYHISQCFLPWVGFLKLNVS